MNWVAVQNAVLLVVGGTCIGSGYALHQRGNELHATRAEVAALKQSAETDQKRLKDDLADCLKERREALTMYDGADKARNQCEAALFVCRDRLAVYEEREVQKP